MKYFLTLILLILSFNVLAEKKLINLVDIHGIRDNELIGYGLVVGLDGTGDKSQVKFTEQSVKNMLEQFGLQLDSRTNPKTKNVAAVSVTAKVGPLTGEGQKLDVVVASIGDAKSLRGGTLLLTPLRGMNGEVYAVAQGNVVVGGLSAEGLDGSSVSVNIPTAGRIPNGAILEQQILSDFNDKPYVTLNLKNPHFKTASNVSKAINRVFGSNVATAISLNQINVKAPQSTSQRVTFLSMLQDISITEGVSAAKVVFNSRTGTVIISDTVKINKAAISHGGITIAVSEDQSVSQPNAFAEGETTVVQESSIRIEQSDPKMFVWENGVDLQTIVNAINSVGASPDDLMQILQALDQVGALNAELVVI